MELLTRDAPGWLDERRSFTNKRGEKALSMHGVEDKKQVGFTPAKRCAAREIVIVKVELLAVKCVGHCLLAGPL
jgi:hypothetical protein